MKRREASFQTLFRHWLKNNQELFTSCAFELKQTTTDSISFSDIAEHQTTFLDAVQQPFTGLLYKIPDDSRGIKPFDMIYMKDCDAYIVIRYPKFFCVIDLDDFADEAKRSKRKSLTSKRARDIAMFVVDIR